jgi:hypothetical protein
MSLADAPEGYDEFAADSFSYPASHTFADDLVCVFVCVFVCVCVLLIFLHDQFDFMTLETLISKSL